MSPADRGYDADWIRALVNQQAAWANIPPKRNRTQPTCFGPCLDNLMPRHFGGAVDLHLPGIDGEPGTL